MKEFWIGVKWFCILAIVFFSFVDFVVASVPDGCLEDGHDPGSCAELCNSDPSIPGCTEEEEACFPAGTEVIMSGGGNKNIEDVVVGDRVISQDESGRQVVSTVTKLDTPISTNMCEIRYIDGESLKLTDNHTMSTVEGWKAINPEAARVEIPSLTIGQLEEGDKIKRVEGGVAEVESYACWSEKQQTYNLILDGTVNTYFANGYLAHNKWDACAGEIGCSSPCCYDACYRRGEYCEDVVDCGFYARCNWNYCCRTTLVCWPDHCFAGCTDYWGDPEDEWSECSVSCGDGVQTSVCGLSRACNEGDCGVDGVVYYDPNNTCSTSNGQNVGGGLSVALRNTAYSGVVGVDGSYSMDGVPVGVYDYLDLGGVPLGYSCSTGCVQGCPTATSVTSPSIGNNFFLTDNAESWWQAVGAGVYAGSDSGGVTIDSDLPLTTTRMVIPGTNDLAAVVRASGSVSVGEGEISDENWSVVSPYQGKTMDYRYFASKMGMTPGVESDFSSGTIEEVEIVGLGQEFYYALDGVDGEVSLGDVWIVTSGESYVIFVDGDLNINKNITVENGGFLAFIVNGGVTVSTGVSSMQGIYVMDDLFVTETLDPADDSQLVVEGMVVAWSGVSLNRYLGGLINRTIPAEQFVYRADFLVNMPPKMKSFVLNWQEVVPGTFD